MSSESKLKAQTIALIIRLESGEFRNLQATVPGFIDPKRPAPVIARIVAAQSEPHDLPEGMKWEKIGGRT